MFVVLVDIYSWYTLIKWKFFFFARMIKCEKKNRQVFKDILINRVDLFWRWHMELSIDDISCVDEEKNKIEIILLSTSIFFAALTMMILIWKENVNRTYSYSSHMGIVTVKSRTTDSRFFLLQSFSFPLYLYKSL